MKWQKCADRRRRGIRRVGLLESHALVGKPTNTAVASKVVIEGAVFLDENHDVLDIGQLRACGGSGSWGSYNGAGAGTTTAAVQSESGQFRERASGAKFQEVASSEVPHALQSGMQALTPGFVAAPRLQD